MKFNLILIFLVVLLGSHKVWATSDLFINQSSLEEVYENDSSYEDFCETYIASWGIYKSDVYGKIIDGNLIFKSVQRSSIPQHNTIIYSVSYPLRGPGSQRRCFLNLFIE